jgi:hypothetical protein
VSRFLEIENVEGFTRAGNDAGNFLGVLREALLFEEGRDSAKRSNIRTGSHKFQKFTTGCEPAGMLSHDDCAC